jgi:hypothetical protein
MADRNEQAGEAEPAVLVAQIRRVHVGAVIEGDVLLGDWLNELLVKAGIGVGERAGIRLTAEVVAAPGAGLPPV